MRWPPKTLHIEEYNLNPLCLRERFSVLGSSEVPVNLTVPSDCLGLDLNPGVYTLLLTTVPTNHSLQYIITWPENEEDIDPDVWVQKLMAVAAVSRERLVHVVFQPLKDFVSLVKVELIDNHGNVKDVKVLKGETDVMFTDVDNGQYRVTLTPEGSECDSDELKCTPLSSEIFSIDQRAKPRGDFFLIVILVVTAPVVLATLLIILCMHRRKGETSNEL
ncbi:hypothetical protein Btru_061475 [Bulinus truncatus]|nr:hypothetical protein Btru_061475 [Bulinus truncatus]